jgi:hypothetical protein
VSDELITVKLLTFASEFYFKMRGACSTRASAGDGADTLLLCDDKFIKWIPNGQPDPEHPESKIEENRKFSSLAVTTKY